MWRWTLVGFMLCSCNVELVVPEGARVDCDSDSECPEGYRCSRGICRSVGAVAPSVTLGPIARDTPSVDVNLTAAHEPAQDLSLVVRYRVGPGDVEDASFSPTTVAATPDGQLTTGTWLATQDLGDGYREGLVLEIQASDSNGVSTTVISDPFAVGNDAPVAVSASVDVPATLTLTGQAVIRFAVTDSSGDPIDVVALEYSLSGDFDDAVSIPLDGGAGGNIPSGALQGLATHCPEGDTDCAVPIEHSVTWNSAVALPGVAHAGMSLRIRVRDMFGGEVELTTDAFDLDNTINQVPIVSDVVATGAGGVIDLSFTVADLESDAADLLVEYIDARGLWREATWVDDPGGQPTGVLTSPVGLSHTFAWDSATDGVAISAAESAVRVRVAASAPRLGAYTESSAFAVDNTAANQAPTVEIIPVAGAVSGRDVLISYLLKDDESDTCGIEIEALADDGVTWVPALRGVGGEGATGLASAPGPSGHH